MKKILLFIIITLNVQILFAQYDYVQINLEFADNKTQFGKYRISMYKNLDSCFVGIKHNPVLDNTAPETWLKRDHDTILDIDESSFINIVEKCINLPSREIILGTNPTNPLLPCAGVNLEINIIGQKIEYNIYSPSEDTKERGLEEFYEVCRDIIELSGMKPKKFL